MKGRGEQPLPHIPLSLKKIKNYTAMKPKQKQAVARLLMAIAALCLLANFVLPLWHIHLIAPQYPDGVGFYIHINKLSDENPGDIQNIDILNHYVGMKPLPKQLPEFQWFPVIVATMAALALIVAVFLRPSLILIWIAIMILLGIAGLYDFYQWLYHYGTNLDPNAPIKLLDENGNPMTYVPPLLGVKQLLNFTVYSFPALGGYLVVVAILLAALSFFLSRSSKKVAYEKIATFSAAAMLLLAFWSCSPEVEPIEFGKDQCDFCRMGIVDPKFAAQAVTKKGRNYKFDAIECLVGFLKDKDEATMAYLLVADYTTQQMTDAKKATYLISDQIHSPMGASLCAFANKEDAEKAQKELGGQLYDWNSLKNVLQK